MDGRFEVSLADSTMMSIVHKAMNKAQEKMNTKTGVLERLNEISKFYELAVMQLEGCITIVHAETESSFLESNHEKLLDDLEEIKDRLQGRLEESESIILEKDRELSQRLKKNQTTSHHNKVRSDGDLCDLRSSMDQQMLNMKQRLEPQQEIVENVVTQPQNIVNDTKKIEEMGSDIDVLKQTMDLAFGKMQSAIFSCEMRPKERQWKLKIEKDMISILIKSFMSEFQEKIEVEARRNENHVHKCWQKHWSQLMNEVVSLKNELVTMLETFPEDYDSSALSSPTKSSSEEGTHDAFRRFFQKMEERDHKEGELLVEEENVNRSLVAKMIKNHESIIRQKNEELNRIKHRKKAASSRKRKELSIIEEKIHILTERVDELIKRNEKQSKYLFNQKAIHDKETLPRKKLSSSQEYEIDLEKMNELNENIERNEIKMEIREDTNFLVSFEEIKDINFKQEFGLSKEPLEDEIDGTIKEDICILVFRKTIEEFNKMMNDAQSEIKEHSKQLDLGSERGDLHEHEIFEDLLTGEEETFSSLTSKVENVLQQLELEAMIYQKLTFGEFEEMVYQKLEILTMRLEKMKCCVDSIIKMVDCLRRKELLYQKAFIIRCQNLQIAEAEVDLLGDQVDGLLTLLEKIYVTLHKHAPALQQNFEVLNILELIKTELISGTVQAATVVT
ncbi:hypothetical protein L195_g002125 [Trifolium pratense]|uniref:WPP domain-associated protein n=1 Tax=Trifolium pratense TaxID=57577 RepID=A0A2K3NRK8_TRIPR|nr:hypothetical protein L195_g002125 [Trifolium pratense]